MVKGRARCGERNGVQRVRGRASSNKGGEMNVV